MSGGCCPVLISSPSLGLRSRAQRSCWTGSRGCQASCLGPHRPLIPPTHGKRSWEGRASGESVSGNLSHDGRGRCAYLFHRRREVASLGCFRLPNRESVPDPVGFAPDPAERVAFLRRRAQAVMRGAAPSAPGWLACRANKGAAGAHRVLLAAWEACWAGSMLGQSSELMSRLISGNCILQSTLPSSVPSGSRRRAVAPFYTQENW